MTASEIWSTTLGTFQPSSVGLQRQYMRKVEGSHCGENGYLYLSMHSQATWEARQPRLLC